MNTNFKEKFTKWYVKRGYTFGYGPTPVYDDGVFRIPTGMPEPYWDCPWWVKPLLIFFSPSVYMTEAWAKLWAEGVEDGMYKSEFLNKKFNFTDKED